MLKTQKHAGPETKVGSGKTVEQSRRPVRAAGRPPPGLGAPAPAPASCQTQLKTRVDSSPPPALPTPQTTSGPCGPHLPDLGPDLSWPLLLP